MSFKLGNRSWPLVLSTAGALLSALQFGINNGNMNTQAGVMRHALREGNGRGGDEKESRQRLI